MLLKKLGSVNNIYTLYITVVKGGGGGGGGGSGLSFWKKGFRARSWRGRPGHVPIF